MGEILPNGEVGGYEGYCPNCRKVIKTNIQGNEIGSHVCNSQNKQVMKIQKQDVEVWVKWTDEPMSINGIARYIHTKSQIINPFAVIQAHNNAREIEWSKSLKDVYILTETELETLKQEYYGIGVKDSQNSK